MNATDERRSRQAAQILKRARVRSGLSMRDLARRAGTSHSTLIAYEKCKKTPSVSTFLRIIEAAGFAVDFDLSRRIRASDGLDRGQELEQVLTLAEQFPARHTRGIAYPRFQHR